MAKIPASAVVCALALGACATREAAPAYAPAAAGDLPQLAAAVAAQLESAAVRDPGRLAALELELRRISDALPAASVAMAPGGAGGIPLTAAPLLAPGPAPASAPADAPAPTVAPAPAVVAAAGIYAPAPELSGARSLFSALTLGAYPSADTARTAWFGMNTAHGEALTGLDARIETVLRDGGATAYVLKAGPFASVEEAETLCARLRQAGAVCTPGDFTGERL